MKTTYQEIDVAAYLDNENVIAEYLFAAAEDPNPDVFVAALRESGEKNVPLSLRKKLIDLLSLY